MAREGIRLTARASILREGILGGLLGAASVAAWFLLVDIARGTPFLVPDALGHILFHMGGGGVAEGAFAHVLAYTAFHVAAFVAVGVFAAAVLRRSERQPSLLAGALLLFVVFECGFFLLTLLMMQSHRLGMPAWYLVASGNLLAAGVMGVYLSRKYPALGARVDAALSGRDGM
ncbi:MAG: hypothetical protein HY084_11815 [Gemmatimonadetes bacterium]|nr:hypothetical protein [Gemmatimonadota bacterium]